MEEKTLICIIDKQKKYKSEIEIDNEKYNEDEDRLRSVEQVDDVGVY